MKNFTRQDPAKTFIVLQAIVPFSLRRRKGGGWGKGDILLSVLSSTLFEGEKAPSQGRMSAASETSPDIRFQTKCSASSANHMFSPPPATR